MLGQETEALASLQLLLVSESGSEKCDRLLARYIVICPSVCLTVCDDVYSGAQGQCRG